MAVHENVLNKPFFKSRIFEIKRAIESNSSDNFWFIYADSHKERLKYINYDFAYQSNKFEDTKMDEKLDWFN